MPAQDRARFGRVVRAGAPYEGKQGPNYTPGVSVASVGSRALWLGSVVLPPRGRTKAHVHENHESAFYLISGEEVELWTGDNLQEKSIAQAGDYLYIPAGVPHVAVNRSVSMPAVLVGARTDPNEQESVVLRTELDARVPQERCLHVTPEERLQREGLALPAPHPLVANYAWTVKTGSLLFVSAHGPFVDGQPAHMGKLGADMTVENGQKAAGTVMLNLLGTLKAELGELSRVSRFVKLLVFVNSKPGFAEHHLVANGATDLLVKAFGDLGRPTRSAVGTSSLPFNFAVELEAIVELRD